MWFKLFWPLQYKEEFKMNAEWQIIISITRGEKKC